MMKETRLYELAYEALLERWGREYYYAMKYPDIEGYTAQEKELWNELFNLENEMKSKGFK